jgi:hypothetical protein
VAVSGASAISQIGDAANEDSLLEDFGEGLFEQPFEDSEADFERFFCSNLGSML